MKKVAARYRRKNPNPFDTDRRLAQNIQRIVTEVEESVSLEELKNFAKRHAPKGFEFIEVIELPK